MGDARAEARAPYTGEDIASCDMELRREQLRNSGSCRAVPRTAALEKRQPRDPAGVVGERCSLSTGSGARGNKISDLRTEFEVSENRQQRRIA